MKIIFITLILSFVSHAQIYEQNRIGTWKLPHSFSGINPLGKFVSKDSDVAFHYPIQSSMIDQRLRPLHKDFLIYKEFTQGFSLGVRYKGPIRIGIFPFKGSRQSFIYKKSARSYKQLTMPQSLADFQYWNPGDESEHQVFGGVEIFGSIPVIEWVDISGAYVIQNDFLISFKKISEHEVRVSLKEGDSQKRSLGIGNSYLRFTGSETIGKSLEIEHDLDLRNPLHSQEFSDILNGRLNSKAYMVRWKRREQEFYFGIPKIAGIIRSWSHMKVNGTADLIVRSKISKGFLVKKRVHEDYAYADRDGITIMWTSHMKKANSESMNKNFYKKAIDLHLKGFQFLRNGRENFGQVRTELGVYIHKSELAGLIQNSWRESRVFIGRSLLKNPGQISSLMKENRILKKVHFKVLSTHQQSWEGLAVAGY